MSAETTENVNSPPVDPKKRKLETEDTPQSTKKPTNEQPEESSPGLLEGIPSELEISLDDLTSSETKTVSMKANRYIKLVLAQWEKSETSDKPLLLDTKKSLFPMLVQLRKSTLDSSQLISLLTILYHLQRGEFMKSTESYMKLSIGNVAWPIGVISVSIHARSRDSKLNSAGANIMIDEKTRRWITGMKRLITFSEKYYDEKKKKNW